MSHLKTKRSAQSNIFIADKLQPRSVQGCAETSRSDESNINATGVYIGRTRKTAGCFPEFRIFLRFLNIEKRHAFDACAQGAADRGRRKPHVSFDVAACARPRFSENFNILH